VWEAITTVAAVAAVNLAQLFAPEIVVVGGGLGLVGKPLLDPMQEMLASWGPAGLSVPVEVVNAVLGDNAALAGAGAWHRAFTPEAASRRPLDSGVI
jgi:glucokinase